MPGSDCGLSACRSTVGRDLAFIDMLERTSVMEIGRIGVGRLGPDHQ